MSYFFVFIFWFSFIRFGLRSAGLRSRGAYISHHEVLLDLALPLAHRLAVLGRLGLKKAGEHDYLETVLISWAGGSAICGLGGDLEPLVGPMLAVLGRSWSLCRRSWAALGVYVGGLGPPLEPLLAVLGRSWGSCWWSWPASRAVSSDKDPNALRPSTHFFYRLYMQCV